MKLLLEYCLWLPPPPHRSVLLLLLLLLFRVTADMWMSFGVAMLSAFMVTLTGCSTTMPRISCIPPLATGTPETLSSITLFHARGRTETIAQIAIIFGRRRGSPECRWLLRGPRCWIADLSSTHWGDGGTLHRMLHADCLHGAGAVFVEFVNPQYYMSRNKIKMWLVISLK